MGYLETIGAYACKNNNYIDSVEKGCENIEPEREKGYLGWFLNLAECLEAYPSPRKGFTFNNVETRSVWIYDGANWRNTTQGNPFHLIYDIEHAGEVKKGYAQTFYYIPTEEDVRGGTITYHFLIDGKDMWVEVDVNYTSDIVFIEWNGSVFVSRVRSLDDRVAYVDSGKVVDRAGNVVVDVADIEDKINKGLKEAVKYTPETKTSSEKAQARSNIDAIGAFAVLKPLGEDIVVLERGGKSIYPYIVPSKIFSPDGKSVEQSIAEEQERATTAEQSLAQNLAELQGRTQGAASELARRIEDEKNRAEGVEQELKGGLKEAVKYTPQDIGANAREQARYNIRAVGYRGTYGNTVVLEADGEVRYPETIATSVKMSNGVDNVENVLIETKEKVDTFLADADTSAEAIDKLKELQDYIKNDETSASQMLGDIAQNKSDIVKNTRHIEYESTRAKQVETYLETQKADKTGYYEQLSVGVADNLVGRDEATEREFVFSASGGANKSIKDGTARITSIQGNSVVWNQQIDNTKWEAQYGEFIVNNGETFIVNGTPPSDGSEYYLGIKQNHNNLLRPSVNDVILLICDYYPIGTTLLGLNYGGHNQRIEDLKENGWNNISLIFTIKSQNATGTLNIILFGGSKAEELRFKNIKIVNLTKMFGKGNEPTTVEEFEARCPQNVSREYNEGTIINNQTTAIKTTGFNAWDEEWELGVIDANGNEKDTSGNIRAKNYTKVISGATYYCKGSNCIFACYDKNKKFVPYNGETGNLAYMNMIDVYSKTAFTIPNNVEYVRMWVAKDYGTIYKHNICIHLTHTGYRNGEYKPYESFTRSLPYVSGGLKSAGNAYDEIRYNQTTRKWEYVKRIGEVDLGTLNWSSVATADSITRWECEVSIGLVGALGNEKANILCARYLTASATETYYGNIGISTNNNGDVLQICDPNYTDEPTFKQSLQGVVLYYELAEPVITEFDSDTIDFNGDYEVWDFGTEEAIQKIPSSPCKALVKYGFNAVDQIRGNTVFIEEEKARAIAVENEIKASVEDLKNSITTVLNTPV